MNHEPAVKIKAPMLAAAFPGEHQHDAKAAAKRALRSLDLRYWWGHFPAEVEGETVLVPVRLHFANYGLPLFKTYAAWLLMRALKTRSTDGHQRQRALRDLLQDPKPWAAPFIISLIGEYVIEILQDIMDGLTPELEQLLGQFIIENKPLWETTKRRVTSYWDTYYRRPGWESSLVFSRDDYVGFKIVGRLDAAALG